MLLTSIIIGRIIGSFFFILGIAMLVDFKYYKKVAKDITHHPNFLMMSGIISLLIGLIIVIFHNYWERTWPLVITIVGWVILVIGGIRLFFPKSVASWIKTVSDVGLLWIFWIITIVGAYLMYMTFFYIQHN